MKTSSRHTLETRKRQLKYLGEMMRYEDMENLTLQRYIERKIEKKEVVSNIPYIIFAWIDDKERIDRGT